MMKKHTHKFISFGLIIAILVCSMMVYAVPVNAAILSCGDFHFRVTGDSATLLDYQGGSSTKLTVPSTVEDSSSNNQYTVTAIGYDCFRAKGGNLKSVSLPSTLTSIGYGAFHECSSLETISIPDSITTIGNFAFDSCTSLKGITIPNNVTSIGDFAFAGCTSLESVSIPASVTELGFAIFHECTALKTATLTSKAGQMMFRGCTALTTVDLGNVKEIEYKMFENCTSLKSVFVSSGNPTIGFEAFNNCPAEIVKKRAGDINNDKKININDATEYQLILADIKPDTDAYNINGNILDDNKRDINDATYIQLYLAKKCSSIPVKPSF